MIVYTYIFVDMYLSDVEDEHCNLQTFNVSSYDIL